MTYNSAGFGSGPGKRWLPVGFTLIILLISGCQSMAGGGGPDAQRVAEQLQKSGSGDGQELSRLQAKLVEGALSLNGRNRLNVNGRRFNADCTGTVLAIYWHAGIDLATPMTQYRGNGVTRLYRFLEDEQALYKTRRPKPGDIIFWDNTYDRDGDGQANDYLTHTGMVVSVEEDGTLHYIHHNYRKGVVLARMNLYRPGVYTEIVDGQQQVINSPMRMRGSPNFDKWLASELTRSFGRAWEVVDKSAFLGG
ncbi:MAG: CHAP domain-containing protein [Spirochaetia bacterium]|nr:CHAP domain-containing protein [Spirochaetia bacterium]